ncbi:MAG: VOC family protein [Acidobacteriota bacterium]|nr:VOC family protein [Acidobacteriota bacterium]MDH3786666.1 VOC family protein [Acidobacteriota bacterium]
MNPVRKTCSLLLVVVAGIGHLAATEPAEAWVETIQSPQYVALYVEDVDRSVVWYRTVFGLRPLGGSAADDGSWRIENLGNKQLLVEIIRDGRAKQVDRALGFRKVGFHVPDVEKVAERVAQATGERPSIVEFEELRQRILQIRDPDGNVIQLMSPLHEK